MSSAYHPQSQGVLERYFLGLKTMTRSHSFGNQKDWNEGICQLMFASRVVVQKSHSGFSVPLNWGCALGGGWIRLVDGFQPLMVISPTARWIQWCMQVYACDLLWACLVWAERSTPESFWVPSHWFISATGEQKGITQTIYTDPEPPSRMPQSLMPSAKLRSTTLPVFTSLVWRGRGSNPGLPHPEWTL